MLHATAATAPLPVRGLLIDLDGVVYAGGHAIAGAAAFLASARRRDVPFLLVTNNSTTTPADVAARLGGMGIPVGPAEVLTSAEAAGAYVRESGGTRALVIGEAGLLATLRGEGVEATPAGTEADGAPTPDWVVVGLDRAFDYARLRAATRAILAGARFVATNADALLPVEGGELVPGAGTMVAAVRAATGVEPVVMGKPEPALFLRGLQRLGGLLPEDVAMVGDRVDTDIDGGRRAGLKTVLVLSGIATAAEGALVAAEGRADRVVPDLPAVARLLGWDSQPSS